jgi:hypothetical protein
MLDLFLATDVVRRKTKAPFEPEAPAAQTRKGSPGRSAVVRSTAAAALRGLANVLEPAHSGDARTSDDRRATMLT